MPEEDVARLDFDWEWLGRPKQLAPDHQKSKATSFCMCAYLEAQSSTKHKLKLENFPSCEPNKKTEVQLEFNPGFTGVTPTLENGGFKLQLVENTEPKVCKFRKDWQTWVLLAGRGFGKTRVGAELVREWVETGQARRIAIISPTAADARDVVVEGESGLLAISPPWNKPVYESTKRRITWPNGAVASLFSAEEPERLRGPQFDAAWVDEIAGYDINTQQMTWDMLQ